MEHIEFAYTCGMDDETVRERLETTETGVLALSKGNDSYAIPLAHYYDGEALYFRLGVTEESRKRAFLDATETATFVLYDTEPTADPQEIDSWSIIIDGGLSEIPNAEHDRFDTAEINRQFSPIRVFGEEIDEIEIRIFELEIESIAGRETANSP
ncbi:pyridoxamine 5'-phosphate oxidase family protein [Halobellus captivus]|uniref:pyridoxamine 5'-phosphate oxidase family protein n=1 Tax=Halobellus captivus TaxID=2592614 RepID=UPI00119CCB15|nr:pyridoxamine 5'-phosphate oxidase family protein [Halobellus captivus]